MNDKAARGYSNRKLLTILGLLCGVLSLTKVSAAPGDLDFSFGVQGRQMILIPNLTHPNSQDWNPTRDIAFQPDGKILVAGSAWDTSIGMDFTVTRFNADGSLDTSFANNGVFRYDFTGSDDEGWGIVLQPDGKIIIAGEAYLGVFSGEVDTAFALIRLNPNGSFDSSFGSNGIVITNFFASLDAATEVALQPDGKIIATGYVTPGGVNVAGAYDFALARYNPDGSLDQTFGTGGTVITDFNGLGDRAQTSVLQPDGKIVLAGWVYTTIAAQIDFGLARYNPDGSLDLTFDGDGKVVTTFGNNLSELARGIALAPDGKLVVAGDFYNPPPIVGQSGHWDVAIARYNTNGSLDASFDGDGRFVYDSNLSDRNEGAEDVVVQPDGKIIFVGDSHLIVNAVPGVSDQDLLMGRLNVDGTFDNSFGNGGRTLTDFGIFDPPGPPNYGSGRTAEVMLSAAVGLQSDGKIVATNDSRRTTNSRRLAISRYYHDSSGPTPSPSPSPGTSPSPSPSPSPGTSPSPSPSPSPGTSPSPSPSPSPGTSPSPSPSPSPGTSPSPSPSPSPGTSPSPSPSPSPGTSPSPSPSPSPGTSPSPSPSPSPGISPSPSPSPSPGISPSPSPNPASGTVNLSTRMRVQTGDNVGIGGFIITGSAPKRVLIRAIGPSLTGFGVPDVLADPVLELHGPGEFVTVTNDNWRDTQEAAIQATGIPPTNDLESAIDATLNPGAYTAIVRGNGNTSGVALIEVYDLNQAVPAKLAKSARAPLSARVTTSSSRASSWATTAATTGSSCAASARA